MIPGKPSMFAAPRFRFIRAILFVLSPLVLLAQTPTTQKLKFEVASVRPSAPDIDHYEVRFSPGSLTYTGITLKVLIRTAYRIQDPQIIGGPSWLDSTRFDLSGKIEGKRTPPEILEMLQQLLEDRFHLVLHKDSRIQSHYSLVSTGSQSPHPGLKKAEEFECIDGSDGTDKRPICGAVSSSRIGRQTQFFARSSPLAQLALILTNMLGTAVENNTGMEGNYEIRFNYGDDRSLAGANDGGDDPGPSIFTALQEQLGLKLQPVKGPVDVFVIDRVEMPGGN